MVPDGLVQVTGLVEATLDGLLLFTLHSQAIVELHVPDTFIPPQAGGCQLVHRPESKPPALDIVLACGEVAAMHP